MKIAYDHQIFSAHKFGGVSRYFVELIKHINQLKKKKKFIKIIAPVHQNFYLTKNIKNLYFKGIKLPNVKGSTKICNLINSFLSPFLLKFYEPDVIHKTYYGLENFNNTHTKKIITVYDMIHELFPKNFPNKDKTAEIKKIAVNKADHIICISKNTQKDLINILGVDIKKTSVVHLGLTLISQKKKYFNKNHKPFILYVGSRGGYKNFSRFIEAYANSNQVKKKFAVVVFGGGPFLLDEIKKINNLKVSNIKQVSGDDDKLASYYQNASLFVYPSLYEGFGLPLLEAMNFGCPVACSNTSSIPEVVGNAAIFFDPYSVKSISKSIEAILLNNKMKKLLVARGFKRAKKFSWKKCAEKTYKVYEKILK